MTAKKVLWPTLAAKREAELKEEHEQYRESERHGLSLLDKSRYSMRARDTDKNRIKMHWGGK